MENLIQTTIFLDLTKRGEKPIGSGISQLIDYGSYQQMLTIVKSAIAQNKGVSPDMVEVKKMICYPGKKAITITCTTDVMQASVEKEPKLGVKFGESTIIRLILLNFTVYHNLYKCS